MTFQSVITKGVSLMISVQEMKQKLKDEYGIESTKDLDEALAKIGGIDISIFAIAPKKDNAADDIKVSA